MSTPMDDLSDGEISGLRLQASRSAHMQDHMISLALAELQRRREADRWRPISEAPKPYRRIIAPYSDGCGARLLWVSPDGGFINDYGDEVRSLFDFFAWSYLPDGIQLWCETPADPITFPEPPHDH